MVFNNLFRYVFKVLLCIFEFFKINAGVYHNLMINSLERKYHAASTYLNANIYVWVKHYKSKRKCSCYATCNHIIHTLFQKLTHVEIGHANTG